MKILILFLLLIQISYAQVIQSRSTTVTQTDGKNLHADIDVVNSTVKISGNVTVSGTANNSSISLTGASVPLSATFAGMNVNGNLVGLSGTAIGLIVDPWPAFQSNATVTVSSNVALSSVQIIGNNPNRRCMYIWNNSANSAYITFGPKSTSASPTAIVPTFTSFVMDAGPIYTGTVSAIRNSGSGTMATTECQP